MSYNASMIFCFYHAVPIIALIGFAGCTHRRVLPFTLSETEDVQPRSADEIMTLGDGLLEESVFLLQATVGEPLPRSQLWVAGFRQDSVQPPQLPDAPLRVLQQAYEQIPKGALSRIRWSATERTSAFANVGIVVNVNRASELVWAVDSQMLRDIEPIERVLFARRPGDYALLLLLNHELAHLALASLPRLDTIPNAIAECAADILGGFHTALTALRISSWGIGGLERSNAISILGSALTPGYWIGRESHPDSDQRAACLNRGVALLGDLSERGPIATSLLPSSSRDSLLNDLVSQTEGLVEVTGILATEIVPVTLPEMGPTSAPSRFLRGEVAAAPIVQLFRDLVSMHDSVGSSLGPLRGPRISTGVTLFPGSVIRELNYAVSPPWRCAIQGDGPPSNPHIACYLVADVDNMIALMFYMQDGIESHLERAALLADTLVPPTSSTLHINLRQWAIRDKDRFAVAGIMAEPYGEWGIPSRYVVWFSFTPLKD